MKSERTIQISRPLLPGLDRLVPELEEILASGQLTNGRHVARFEALVAERVGNADVVALSSNTTGMVLAWRALGVEGEVLVPAFTFPATVHALLWNGLTPVLVDCDRETFNIDVEDARRRLTDRTAGIAPVYIFGNAPDWARLEPLIAEHELACVSDAAHAFGTLVGDRPAGTFGDVEVFSLAPTKVLTTGEGGLAITRNRELADRLKRMRNYGNPGDYNCRELGLNGRMTEIHALIGIHALPGHEAQLDRRQRLAELYRDALHGVPGVAFQKIAPAVRSTHNYFAILIEAGEFGLSNRQLKTHLAARGVESKIYFHPPIHEQTLYRHLAGPGSMPNTEWLCERILCLPITNHVTDEDAVAIASLVRDAHRDAASLREAIGPGVGRGA